MGCSATLTTTSTRFCLKEQERFLADLPDSADRHKRILSLLRQAPRPLTVKHIRQVLSDHQGYPRSICRHAVDGEEMKTITSIISEPAAGRMQVSKGNPCQGPHYTYVL